MKKKQYTVVALSVVQTWRRDVPWVLSRILITNSAGLIVKNVFFFKLFSALCSIFSLYGLVFSAEICVRFCISLSSPSDFVSSLGS